MLFYLKFINHDVEKLHDILVFFFNRIRQDNPTVFDVNTLFPQWYSDDTFDSNRLRGLEAQLREFLTFDEELKSDIAIAFENANRIESVFLDSNVIIPVANDFITKTAFLNELFTTLYEKQLSPRDSTFSKKIKTNLYEHYDKLHTNGAFTVCPVCGIERLKMLNSEGRPDYDHLLAKGDSLFVFSAINLKNLLPTGGNCNRIKDTNHLLYTDANRTTRTIAFYPYSASQNPYLLINFNLTCNRMPAFRLQGEWSVAFLPKDINDETLTTQIASWNRVFNIQNRYADYIKDMDNTMIANLYEAVKLNLNIFNSLTQKIQRILDDDLRLEYSFIANKEGLIPCRIFYQWALNNPDFLSGFVAAKAIDTNLTKVDLNF
jgi:hypothetical protein